MTKGIDRIQTIPYTRTMKRRWTENELAFMKENYVTMSVADIAKYLGRTVNSVSKMAYMKGVKLSPEQLRKRYSDSGRKNTKDQFGTNNPNWKNGISQDHYHYKKIQVERYPEKMSARKKVRYAVLSGKIKKLPCEVCGNEESFAHHDDYSKPLEVVWLCRKHHRERHGNRC